MEGYGDCNNCALHDPAPGEEFCPTCLDRMERAVIKDKEGLKLLVEHEAIHTNASVAAKLAKEHFLAKAKEICPSCYDLEGERERPLHCGHPRRHDMHNWCDPNKCPVIFAK